MTLKDVASSLEGVLAQSPRDWSLSKYDAWIYGIVNGWDSSDPGEDAMSEVAARHRWDEATVQRLQELHAAFRKAVS